MAHHSDAKRQHPLCAIKGCTRVVSFNRKKFPKRCYIWTYCNTHRYEYSLRKCVGCHEIVSNDRDIGPGPFCSNACLKQHTDEAMVTYYKPAPLSSVYCCWCSKGFDFVFYTAKVGDLAYPICSEICGQEQAAASENQRAVRMKESLCEGFRIHDSNCSRLAALPITVQSPLVVTVMTAAGV